jgi:hypothetical protein
MKQFIAIVFILLCSSCGQQKSLLIGKWKSDHALTMDFIQKHEKMEPKTEQFLSSIMGHLTLTFTEKSVTTDLPDLNAMVKGKEMPFKGSHYTTTYKILYQSEKAVVLSGIGEFTGKAEVTTYNFDTPDIMWVYTGGAESATPDSHSREYFRRVH